MDYYRVLVTGSRDWADEAAVENALDAVIYASDVASNEEVVVVHGACPTGADAIADRLAREAGCRVEPYPADWSRGRRAGPERNRVMVEAGADVCVAFIGACSSPRCRVVGVHASHGASGCADLAEAAGIRTERIVAVE